MLTVNQAAERLKTTPTRVRQFLLEGRLNGTKFGHAWQIDEQEFRRFARKPRRPGWKKGRPRGNQ